MYPLTPALLRSERRWPVNEARRTTLPAMGGLAIRLAATLRWEARRPYPCGDATGFFPGILVFVSQWCCREDRDGAIAPFMVELLSPGILAHPFPLCIHSGDTS
jgi:hypothetical protein